jgi:hypothetical protein
VLSKGETSRSRRGESRVASECLVRERLLRNIKCSLEVLTFSGEV